MLIARAFFLIVACVVRILTLYAEVLLRRLLGCACVRPLFDRSRVNLLVLPTLPCVCPIEIVRWGLGSLECVLDCVHLI